MTALVSSPRRTPSISEIQAALQAARHGQFATPDLTGEPQQGIATGIGEQPVGEPRTKQTDAPVSVVTASSEHPVSAAAGDVALISVHGGAGGRTLARVIPGSHYAGHGWPTDQSGRVVLVCRNSHRGYIAAQEFARAHRDDEQLRRSVDLAGIVVVADCPGRLPPALRRLERLVSGAVPILGHVPWMAEWRLGPPDSAAPAPEWATKLAAVLKADQ